MIPPAPPQPLAAITSQLSTLNLLPPSGAGGGGGKSGGSARVAREAADTLRSIQRARVLDLLSEGPIYGLEDQDHPERCILLDDTPLENADGSKNFKGYEFYFLEGTLYQSFMPGFVDAETVVSVNVQVKTITPWTQHISTGSWDAVRVTIRVPVLRYSNPANGDVDGSQVQIKIQTQNGAGGFVDVLTDTIAGKASSPYERSYRIEKPAGATGWDVRVIRLTADSTTNPQNDTYLASYVGLVDAKLTYPNSAVAGLSIDAEQFSNIPKRGYRIKGRLIQVPVNYDPEARRYTGTWDGTFKTVWSNNPAWCYYDLIRHTRYGLGRKIPAELVDKWGLYAIGQYCDGAVPTGEEEIEVWHQGSYGSGADQLVFQGDGNLVLYAGATVIWQTGPSAATQFVVGDDGNLFTVLPGVSVPWSSGTNVAPPDGSAQLFSPGVVLLAEANIVVGYHRLTLNNGRLRLLRIPSEPRFTCNLYLQTRDAAYRVLNDMVSIFRGMIFYAAAAVMVVQDSPADPIHQFTPANVVGGRFTYAGTASSARHTMALVTWTNLDDPNRPGVEPVEDEDAVIRWGLNLLELTAFGCTSRGQAHRLGDWALKSEQLETETVQFTAGLEGAVLKPGDIIQTSDPTRAGRQVGGRVKAVSSTSSVVLDRPVQLDVGKTYTLMLTLEDGTIESRTVSTAAPATTPNLAVSLAYSQSPLQKGVWILQSTDLAAERWRALNVKQGEKATYEVTALQHAGQKYARVEQNLILPPLPVTVLPSPRTVQPPGGVPTVTAIVVATPQGLQQELEVTWPVSPDPFLDRYRVSVRKGFGNVQPFEALAPSLAVPVFAPVEYFISVQAVNRLGYVSASVSVSYTLTAIAPAVFGTKMPYLAGFPAMGSGTASFDGPDVSIEWSQIAPMGYLGPTDIDPLFQCYVVEFLPAASFTPVRTEIVTDARYTVTLAKNIEIFGVPTPAFRVQVRVRNRNGATGAPQFRGFENGPVVGGTTLAGSATDPARTLTWTKDTVLAAVTDLGTWRVTYQRTAPTSGAAQTVVVPAAADSFFFAGIAGETYDFKVAPVDVYGQVGSDSNTVSLAF